MTYEYENFRKDKTPFGKPVEVSTGVYLFRQPMSFQPGHINCYLIEGADGFTVVDTGNYNDDTPQYHFYKKILPTLSLVQRWLVMIAILMSIYNIFMIYVLIQIRLTE